MTDHETTQVEVAVRRTSVARIGLLGAGAAALLAAAILVFGATAAPSGTLAAADGSSAAGVDVQGRGPGDGDMGRLGGSRGFGDITITAISGSSVSLKTADGWTRTIAIASDTALAKGGATITLSDLKVGDEVRFQQTRGTDGSFTITKLNVVLPHVGGIATAVSGSTITVTERDGTSATINVTSATTYEIGRTTGKALADVKVGMFVGAVGTLNADGSLTATAVRAVDPASMPGPGRHGGHSPWGDGAGPDAAPAATADTSAG